MTTRKLDRLNANNSSGLAFQRLWQKNAELVEGNLGDLQDQIDAITAATATANAALASANAALSQMPAIAPVALTSSYEGVVDPSDQLPATVRAYRFQNSTDVSASSTWSIAADSGAVTASIDTTGLVTLTAAVGPDSLTVTSVYNSITRTALLAVSFDIAQPPATGSSSGSTATDTSFSGFASATMTAVSDELSVLVGSGGQVSLSAPLRVSTSPTGRTGGYPVAAIWRHWDGSAYVDVGTEVASSPDCSISDGVTTKGIVTVSNTVTGLTSGATEKFQLYALNASDTSVMHLSGTASVVGS